MDESVAQISGYTNSQLSGMAANAEAPRNGTLRNETTLPLANQPRQDAAYVAGSACACSPFMHLRFRGLFLPRSMGDRLTASGYSTNRVCLVEPHCG